jgi:type II secretory pathway component PulF
MTQQPLDYASPLPAAARSRPLGPAIWLIAWMIFDALVVTIALGLITPPMERLFKEFKVPLPTATQLWLLTSRWFVNDYGWVFLWLFVVSASITVLMLRPPARGPQRTWAWIVLMLLVRYAWVPFAIWAVFSLMMPYINLIDSVSSPPRR